MSNKNLAMILHCDYEDEFDELLSDVELMRRVKELAHEEFSITNEDAAAIGREVLRIYNVI